MSTQAAADAWGHEVFSLCSEPEGRIPVGGVAPLLWKFSPLEAKVRHSGYSGSMYLS